MKSFVIAAVLTATSLTTGAGWAAQPGSAKQPAATAGTTLPLVNGLVRRVDPAAARVTIAHGPIPNINMPPMTMVFTLKDPNWISRIKAGAQIRFSAEDVNGQLVITRLE